MPIIAKITKGSLKNKLVILLPAALLLSAFLPWAITPILMLGGLYLSYEGAEKIIEKLGGEKHGETLGDPIDDPAEFENHRVAGAIRTDLILSAEIMAITLASVAEQSLLNRALMLAIVGAGITFAVYGAVALIVKMDDIGLHLAKRQIGRARRSWAGCWSMPCRKVLAALSAMGTVAMLWVGGGIVLHGLEELGLGGPAEIVRSGASMGSKRRPGCWRRPRLGRLGYPFGIVRIGARRGCGIRAAQSPADRRAWRGRSALGEAGEKVLREHRQRIVARAHHDHAVARLGDVRRCDRRTSSRSAMYSARPPAWPIRSTIRSLPSLRSTVPPK